MTNNQDLLTMLATGLEAAAQTHTVTNLGDRQSYLGMSDLALGLWGFGAPGPLWLLNWSLNRLQNP